MLEQLDLTKKISKGEYKKVFPDIAKRLGELQREVKELGIPVLLVFEGWEAAGKGTIMNELILPLDPRGYEVRNYHTDLPGDAYYPPFWRPWRWTPAKGRILICNRSWYKGLIGFPPLFPLDKELPRTAMDDIASFERTLAEGGTLILKFFFHISEKEQRRRLKKMRQHSSTAWRASKEFFDEKDRYEKLLVRVEEVLPRTDAGHAPWIIVESHDRRYAAVKVLESVLLKMEEAVRNRKAFMEMAGDLPELSEKEELSKSLSVPTVLQKVDLSQFLHKEEYQKELRKWQKRFRTAQYGLYRERIPMVIAFEGWDAAGKGGCIRRLVQKLDPRGYEVVPVGAPNDVEKAHHYLWRFWENFPKAGHVTVFDRTWYGRVLVERVENLCLPREWRRAYGEINSMESQWAGYGTVIVKFWLHIDQDEQLRRFQARQEDPYKQWKITDEDWRNREKWPLYEEAVEEMLWRTNTHWAPWTVVEARDKYFARIKVLQTAARAAEKALEEKEKSLSENKGE
ncbi:MAG TPA: polyphosphate:AMP phosphotransferase [Synergistaceae bacterium]|nr:polyphosphate:AMP phosphotransferase [Synergistaceae bacterium]HPJ25905.1 polyphosphate:AMP phosphotransferase [Synergistaceae bacterium]HPQ36904.1 polyphosphate:AMP phosphotransferase [Synergistaceae bacterium]